MSRWYQHLPQSTRPILLHRTRIKSVRVNADRIQVSYEDGRDLAVPVTFYWRLADATPEQLQNFEISPSGRGIHWPDVDEDLSAKGLLEGMPRATVSA